MAQRLGTPAVQDQMVEAGRVSLRPDPCPISGVIPCWQEVSASCVALIFMFTVVIFPFFCCVTFSHCFFLLSLQEFSVKGKASLILSGLR